MHTGRSYRLFEFLDCTRRDIYVLIVLGIVPAVAYQTGNLKWLALPWTVVALLGTATAFVVGFKNLQSYNRTWEARQIWGDIISSSRAWGTMSRAIKGLLASQVVVVAQFVDMHRSIKDFLSQQGRCERIKDFPYPRQFAAIPSSSRCSAFCFPSACSRTSTASMKASRGRSRDRWSGWSFPSVS